MTQGGSARLVSPPQLLGEGGGLPHTPTVSHSVGGGVEIHQVPAVPCTWLRAEGAQPQGRRAPGQGAQLGTGTDKRTGGRHAAGVPAVPTVPPQGPGGCRTSLRKPGAPCCLQVTGTVTRGDRGHTGTVTAAWGHQPGWDTLRRALGTSCGGTAGSQGQAEEHQGWLRAHRTPPGTQRSEVPAAATSTPEQSPACSRRGSQARRAAGLAATALFIKP